MTNKTYNKLWKTTVEKLTDILQEEDTNEDKVEQQERVATVQKTSLMYLRCIKIANNFIDCYENILQPQKRILLRNFVDNTIGRVLELKHELVSLEFSEFHFLDDKLLAAKMVPSDMNVKIPSYFHIKRGIEKDHFELIQELLKYFYSDESTKPWSDMRMPPKEAWGTIIAHERARRGRVAFVEAQKLYEMKEENKMKEYRKNLKIDITENTAARRIQGAWRWFIFHKKFKAVHRAEMNLLGMQPFVTEETDKFHVLHLLDILKKDRRDAIEKNEREFLEATESIKKDMQTYEAPKVMEELQARIREYFEKYRQKHGEYPTYPTEEEGGSTAMLQTAIDDDNELEKPKNGAPGKEKVTESKKEEKDLKDDEEMLCYSSKISKYIPDLVELVEEYQKIWAEKELDNYFDKYEEKLIREKAVKEMEASVRISTDKIMREELNRLTEAFERDLGKKGKKGGKKAGKKGGKKDKGKGKGKKDKDLTPNRSFESLVEELIKERIIINYPKFNLSDFVGDYNYVGSMKQYECDPEKEPVPCLGDIRRVVNEYCILPMGSPAIHSKGAFIKSILFVGPHGSGKKSLIHAICNEIGATLMDLSAENVNGKYPGKEGLDMLMHLVYKVGRLAQPTVIYIKDAENYFWRKQPATSILAEAVRLKKELPKLMKAITNDDRILICGTSVTPFDVDLKGMSSCYSKIICIYSPDHNCRRALWSKMILKHKGIISPQLGLGALSGVSDGFTAPHIKYAVKQTLTERRLFHQFKFPLVASEFIPFLSDRVPIPQEENDEYKIWLSKMPLQKRRFKVLKEESGEITEEPKIKEKQNPRT